jgi:DNA adenine methylase
LAPFVKSIILANGLSDGEYVEPFAGGAAVAFELLLQEYVAKIRINDISRPVYAFWKAVLSHTDALCKRVRDSRLTVAEWDKQKSILAKPDEHDDLQLGFATFFLNRTNRSGILNGGIIGGREQTGAWKIDARYNAAELVNRIESIAKMRNRIRLTNQDALRFLKAGTKVWPKSTLIYLDPPYYEKARDLYYHFYNHADHARVASFVTNNINQQRWIVSYDNAAPIRELYAGCGYITYTVGYSARDRSEGAEIMFFDDGLVIPSLAGPITATGAVIAR